MWPEEPEEGTDLAEADTAGVTCVCAWLGRARQAPCRGRSLGRCRHRAVSRAPHRAKKHFSSAGEDARSMRSTNQGRVKSLPDTFSSTLLGLFQLEEDRPSQHSLPRYSPLRRLASSVFSSSTLETEHYPHVGGTFIQRSRSAESSPVRMPHRRHMPLTAGNHRLMPSVLRISRSQLQQVWARFTHKT